MAGLDSADISEEIFEKIFQGQMYIYFDRALPLLDLICLTFNFILLAPHAIFCSGCGAACSPFVHTRVSSNVVVVVIILQNISSLLPLS